MEADLKKKNASENLYIDITYVYPGVEDIFFFLYPECKEESFSLIRCRMVWYLEENGGIHGIDEEAS